MRVVSVERPVYGIMEIIKRAILPSLNNSVHLLDAHY